MTNTRNSIHRTHRWLLAGMAMLCIGAVHAQGVELTNEVFQQTEAQAADGSTFMKTVPATTIVPGTEVIYVITYRNTGDQAADEVTIDNPVPAELDFVATAGERAVDAVSVDGGAQYGALTELTVVGEDGASRPAQAADVTHLRWVLGTLEAGAEGKVSFVARVK